MIHLAKPAPGFARPPYRAQLLDERVLKDESLRSPWAGVMNSDGFNCLTWSHKPGAVVTSLAAAIAIADLWNTQMGYSAACAARLASAAAGVLAGGVVTTLGGTTAGLAGAVAAGAAGVTAEAIGVGAAGAAGVVAAR